MDGRIFLKWNRTYEASNYIRFYYVHCCYCCLYAGWIFRCCYYISYCLCRLLYWKTIVKFTKADRMCYTKRRYPSMIKAHCALGTMLGRYSENAIKTWRVYQCPVCAGYHLTRQSQDNPEYQKRLWMSGNPLCGVI